MKIWKSAALVAVAALVAGCQGLGTPSPSTSGRPSATPAVRPIDELNAAVAKLGTTTHKYTVKAGDATILGSVDPSSKGLAIDLSASGNGVKITAQLVRVGADIYAKVEGLTLPGFDNTKWYHLDGSRVTTLAMFGIGEVTDPFGLLVLAAGIRSVEKTGDRTFKGTFDLSKPISGLTPQDLKDLGEKAKNIPFEATLDGQGRLASVTFSVPAIGSQAAVPVDLRVSDYGATMSIAKPAAAQVIEAPEFVYTLLNSM